MNEENANDFNIITQKLLIVGSSVSNVECINIKSDVILPNNNEYKESPISHEYLNNTDGNILDFKLPDFIILEDIHNANETNSLILGSNVEKKNSTENIMDVDIDPRSQILDPLINNNVLINGQCSRNDLPLLNYTNENNLINTSLILDDNMKDNNFVEKNEMDVLELTNVRAVYDPDNGDFNSELQDIIVNNNDMKIGNEIETVSEKLSLNDENLTLPSKNLNYSKENVIFKQNWTSKAKLCYMSANPTTKIKNNYLRGCLWSPDGTCLLTNSNDNIMRIYELPRDGYNDNLYRNEIIQTEIKPVLNVPELDLIYDYCWYPFMNSNNPDTCLFASTSRKGSIRLWDAYHGTERAHVQPYDHLVEPVSAQSIAFSRDGLKMYCGFNRCLRVFDITRLNSAPDRRPRIGQKSELRGIISCIATSAANIGMYGCGSFSKDAAIYHEQSGDQILEFLRTDDRVGGITHIEFSPNDMNLVATGGRIDNAIHLWDLRSMGSPIYSTIKRDVRTNQRIYFQFDPTGKYIVTGNHSGCVSVYDINGDTCASDDYLLPKVAEWQAHNDVCNGLSLHPSLPIVATASGQRRLTPPWLRAGMMQSVSANIDSDDDSDWSSDDQVENGHKDVEENEVRVWRLDTVVV